jgi:MFS family permease
VGPVGGRLAGLGREWRPSEVTQGLPTYPLLVLFGLNAVDELDRTAFAVLLPDIRDHFGLSDAGALAMVSASTIAALVVGIPISFLADRRNRVRIAATGAAAWGALSAATGLATSTLWLTLARVGAGCGRAVNVPTHSSLLSDHYPPETRVKVFSVHGQANSLGQVLGPLLGGLLAVWLGWRAPFLLFALPTIVLVVLALRMHEPERGGHERAAAGAGAAPPEGPESFAATFRILHGVRTLRRIWLAIPFLGVAIFGVPNLLSLVYEDVFDLGAGARGAITAAVEPLQIAGIWLAMPRVAAVANRDPGFLLRFVAVVGIADGVLLVLLANAPSVPVAVAVHALLAASIGTLAPAFYSLISVVAPPRVRAAAFATIPIFAVPGIAVFLPLIGAVSDAHGVQASLLVLVPVAVAAGLILASAGRFVADDATLGGPAEPEPGEVPLLEGGP